MGSHAVWPSAARDLAAFLYTPEIWARARGLRWDTRLEEIRRAALTWLYHLAGVPAMLPDGRLVPRAAQRPVTVRRSPMKIPVPSLGHARFALRRLLNEQAWPMVETRTPISWAVLAEGSRSAQEKHALTRVLKQLDRAFERTWKLCSLCARAFPSRRNTKTCPPCRRKWTPRQIQRRIEKAAPNPVIIDPDDRWTINLDVSAPPALRRLSTSDACLDGRSPRLPDITPPRAQHKPRLCKQCREPFLAALTLQITKRGSSPSVTVTWPERCEKCEQSPAREGSYPQANEVGPSGLAIDHEWSKKELSKMLAFVAKTRHSEDP